MLEYSEKRDYLRMTVECAAQVRVNGDAQASPAIVKDLSASGLLMWLDREVSAGTTGEISVLPGKTVTPPLSAKIEVVRCDPVPDQDGVFAAACTITEIMPEAVGEPPSA